MANPSRWTRWVVTESADPRLPLPWTLTGARRNRRAPSRPEIA